MSSNVRVILKTFSDTIKEKGNKKSCGEKVGIKSPSPLLAVDCFNRTKDNKEASSSAKTSVYRRHRGNRDHPKTSYCDWQTRYVYDGKLGNPTGEWRAGDGRSGVNPVRTGSLRSFKFHQGKRSKIAN